MTKELRKSSHSNRILLFLITCLVTLTGFSSAWAQPKNVIILIGDGMGFEHVKAAGMYANGFAGTLLFESFPYEAQVTTHSADSSITDSAAAGTAIATGYKVNNDVVSVAIPANGTYSYGSEMKTLLEYFRDNGKMTGLVTTVTITHATPAAFGAHDTSRNNTNAIAVDLLQQTRPNVIFGAGGSGMSESAAQTAGYTVVTNRSSMQGLNTETASMVSGQFATGQLPYEYDGSFATMPHLSEMTATALAILDNDPDGYFLMIEGGLIDWAAHDNNRNRTILETIEFNDTVQVITGWAKAHTDTLIMVTADHETGGLLVTQNNGQGVFPTVNWSTTGHTGVNVGIYANGENAQLFTGTIDNTDIYGKVTATTSTSVNYYCDDDEDRYISSSVSGACTGSGCEPYGCQTSAGFDCEDGNDEIYPGATEVVADGIDQDCNGRDRCYEDLDGDTFGSAVETDDVDSDLNCSTGANVSGSSTDCNDGDALEYPGQTWYEDVDGDLYSSGNINAGPCQRLVNYYAASELTATTGDCNDTNININPGAADICDGTDNDCNAGTADGSAETAPSNTLQAGVCAGSTKSCTGGVWTDDYSGVSGYEAAELTCDELDNDCDSAVDEGLRTTYYQDSDGDTYGNVSVIQQACSQPVGYVPDNTDCNDTDININPGVSDICDGIDNDCNAGTTDGSGEAAPSNTLQAGVCTGSTQSCTGGVWTDDYSGVSGYEAVELTCDNQDNDCDGSIDESLTQPTSCGVGACAAAGIETCSAGVWGGNTCTPGTPTTETCNNIDDNCNGTVDESLTQPTSCGVGACAAAGIETCSAGVWGGNTCTPGTPTTETCNNIDDNCNGTVDEGCDDDGDGYCDNAMTVSGAPVPVCTASVNGPGEDCDDNDPYIYPEGPLVRISGTPPEYYTVYQNSYNAAAADDIIQSQDAELTEDIILNHNITVIIEAGYDCSFTNITGTTIINGNMTFSDGSVIIQNGTLAVQ